MIQQDTNSTSDLSFSCFWTMALQCLVDAGGGEPLAAADGRPPLTIDRRGGLSGAAVVSELLLQVLSVAVAVVVEGAVPFYKGLDLVLGQTTLLV